VKLDAHAERVEDYCQQYASLEVFAINATSKASSDYVNVIYKSRAK